MPKNSAFLLERYAPLIKKQTSISNFVVNRDHHTVVTKSGESRSTIRTTPWFFQLAQVVQPVHVGRAIHAIHAEMQK